MTADLLRNVGSQTDATVRSVERVLDVESGTEIGMVNAEELLENPPGSMETFLDRVRAATEALCQLIVDRPGSPTSGLEEPLAAGQYLVAARLIAAGNQAAGVAMTDSQLTERRDSMELRSDLPDDVIESLKGPVLELPGRITIDPARTRLQIGQSLLAQSLIAGLGLVLVAYSLFGADYIGTLGDVAKVIFWGYSTDIGVNVLLDQARGLTPQNR